MKLNSYKYLPLTLLPFILAPAFGAVKPTRPNQGKALVKQTPITPAILRGKIIVKRSSDVWMIDPTTRREQMIFKNPFFEGPWAPWAQDIIFSPDLKRVVFTHEPKDGKVRQFTGNELFSMNLDRSGKIQLTNTNWMDYSFEPHFSPDGKQIVYTQRSGYRMGGPGYTGMEIRVVNADGSNNRRVIGNIGDVSQSYFGAVWSHDGKRLLFTHYMGNIDYDGEGAKKWELQTCALDGSDVQPFDNNYSGFLHPSVSPDGKFRTVVEPIDPKISIYPDLRLFTSSGKSVRALTLHLPDLAESNPHWSADSKNVVFEATQMYTDVDKAGRAQNVRKQGIWLVGVDGKNLRRLTTDASLVAWLR